MLSVEDYCVSDASDRSQQGSPRWQEVNQLQAEVTRLREENTRLKSHYEEQLKKERRKYADLVVQMTQQQHEEDSVSRTASQPSSPSMCPSEGYRPSRSPSIVSAAAPPANTARPVQPESSRDSGGAPSNGSFLRMVPTASSVRSDTTSDAGSEMLQEVPLHRAVDVDAAKGTPSPSAPSDKGSSEASVNIQETPCLQQQRSMLSARSSSQLSGLCRGPSSIYRSASAGCGSRRGLGAAYRGSGVAPEVCVAEAGVVRSASPMKVTRVVSLVGRSGAAAAAGPGGRAGGKPAAVSLSPAAQRRIHQAQMAKTAMAAAQDFTSRTRQRRASASPARRVGHTRSLECSGQPPRRLQSRCVSVYIPNTDLLPV